MNLEIEEGPALSGLPAAIEKAAEAAAQVYATALADEARREFRSRSGRLASSFTARGGEVHGASYALILSGGSKHIRATGFVEEAIERARPEAERAMVAAVERKLG